jgi:hypothetical protein
MKRIGVLCFLVWALAGISGTAWSCDGSTSKESNLGLSATADSLVTPAPAKPRGLTHRRAIVDDRGGPMVLLHAIIVSPKWSEVIQAPRERPMRVRSRIGTFSAAWST